MKQIVTATVILFFGLFASAQEGPVDGSYTGNKIADKTYEVPMQAKIESPGHTCSQKQPEGAVNIPVSVEFSANSMLALSGIPKEIGKAEKSKDMTAGVEANEFRSKAHFVQTTRLKANIKTNRRGTIHFQECNEEMCFPPMNEKFTAKFNSKQSDAGLV